MQQLKLYSRLVYAIVYGYDVLRAYCRHCCNSGTLIKPAGNYAGSVEVRVACRSGLPLCRMQKCGHTRDRQEAQLLPRDRATRRVMRLKPCKMSFFAQMFVKLHLKSLATGE